MREKTNDFFTAEQRARWKREERVQRLAALRSQYPQRPPAITANGETH